MVLQINSKKLSRKLTFSRPGNFYIFVDMSGKPGTLGEQICAGGRIFGDTLGYSGDDMVEFNRICRAWYKSYVMGFVPGE